MKKERKITPVILITTFLILFLFLIMQPLEILQFREKIAVLFPKGEIALEERNLLLIIQLLMLLVIIPVYILTFIFSWRYRADHSKAHYDPTFVNSSFAECIWWGIPCGLILIIGALTWGKTYQLDPYQSIVSDKKPITIQVVALQWQWLFIYPEEKIASVNLVRFPKEVPVHFEITADAPMNSFWIPHLSGQIYAMPSMKTELNLIANELGEFRGSSANFSGEGFSDMHFIAEAMSEEKYREWVESTKQDSPPLTLETYKKLAIPSKDQPVRTYLLKEQDLFDQILMKYTASQT